MGVRVSAAEDLGVGYIVEGSILTTVTVTVTFESHPAPFLLQAVDSLLASGDNPWTSDVAYSDRPSPTSDIGRSEREVALSPLAGFKFGPGSSWLILQQHPLIFVVRIG